MPRTLALTGATGFIGTALRRQLVSDGWEVRALHRRRAPQPQSGSDDTRIRWVCGSLSDPDSLRRLLKGASAVVHCAGAVRGASAEQFNQVNVAGVARLVQAARELHPTPRFLLISSLAAREPALSFYAASKRGGEDTLRTLAGPMATTIFRPPAVYGPGDREMAPLLRCMQHGVAPVLGSSAARFSMLYVEDLTEAIRQTLARPDWAPGPFEIHDGHPGGYSWEEVMTTVSRILRRPVRALRVPVALLRAAAAGNLLLAQLCGTLPMLTPGKVRELTHPDWVCHDAPLREATGWTPRIRLEAGMRLTIDALRADRDD
ncbi:MAG TPA: SDR family NAD(P)-dependent oxidoreductase [Desulfobacterales bacterium]|nr:SDR family NAD(P)-dependent oxidoreductase [Desulfobacterales bacterium]